jgi:AP-2 complex subunit alpha
VDRELANVRASFAGGKMSLYDRKKYVWKLVYMNMMGIDIDFGQMEMIALLSSTSYAEKLVGYMAVSVMMSNSDPNMPLVVQAIKSDLSSTQDPIQCLALCAASNIGGKALAEEVKDDVISILFSRSIFPVVRKKAALCLLRLTRVKDLQLPTDEWRNKLTPLLEDRNMGVVLCVVSLILGLAEAAGKDAVAFDGCTSHLLVLLSKLALQKTVAEDYLFFTVACPWLQVKILRLLQQFPVPALERNRSALNDLLGHILSKTEVTRNANRNNAEHSVLFEAIALVVKQGDLSLPNLREKALKHLSHFINIKEPNIRYLGLNAMATMLGQEGCDEAIRKQNGSIMFSLKDADISVRRRALGLLFVLCNKECAEALVKDLLTALALADFQFRDELVLKIAILSERHSPSLQWYVDVVIQMISIAGDHVSDEIWHRLVQVVTNNGEALQGYASRQLYTVLESATAHQTAVKVGAYVLAEFGYLITEDVGGARQFAAIHQHFPRCSNASKCILLSAYAKMRNLYPELTAFVNPVFEAHTTCLDAELQQRAVEYLHLPELPDAMQAEVLTTMPAFSERENHLETMMKKQEVRFRPPPLPFLPPSLSLSLSLSLALALARVTLTHFYFVAP